MRRLRVTFGLVLALTAGQVVWVYAQADAIMGRIRGQVVDQNGQPLRDVTVEAVHTRTAKKVTMNTDKKGGFVRVGIPEGDYEVTLTKAGYKTAKTKVWISLGGLSEIPPVTLQALPPGVAAAAVASEPGTAAPPAPPVEMDADALAAVQTSFSQAVEAAKAGRVDEAEALYKEILVKAPKLAEVHYNLGVLYRQRQDWPNAEAELRRSIELQPDRSDSYVALAGVLQSANRRDEAGKLLADAGDRFAQDAPFQFALGVRAFNGGQTDAAAEAFKKVRGLDPGNPEPVYYLGVIALGKNETAEAVSLLEAYLGSTGQDPQNLALAQGILKAVKTAPKR